MAYLKDALGLVLDELKARHEAEKKRKQVKALTDQPLNYQIIEDIVRTVSAQKPGVYAKLFFKDGNQLVLGVNESSKPPARQPNETF